MSDREDDGWLAGEIEAVLARLTEFMRENGLTEIEVEENGRRVRLSSSVGGVVSRAGESGGGFSYTTPPEGQSESLGGAEAVPANAIVSPMVGTVYLAAEPGAPPFVRAGDNVREGDTLLIIEAMKVMNPLVAPRSGVVGDIFVQDSQPVEYGQPLLVIS
ncbi:MAG: acetyl-CoA carboxylase, biotin carboxyl carrier protein [Alphaproteobacteria bacterium]